MLGNEAMRLVWGVLSLLLVLGIVGFLAKKQLPTVRSALTAEVAGAASMPSLSGTPAQQSLQLQDKLRQDMNKAMEQAPARVDAAQ